MKIVPKLLYSILFVLLSGVAIAGPGGDGPPPPGIIPPPGFPIDSNILILIISAIALGAYSAKKYSEKKS